MGVNLRTMEEVQLGIIDINKHKQQDITNFSISTITRLNICFTGKIPNWTRDRLESWTLSHGGNLVDNVTRSNTHLLIVGEGASRNSKVALAKRYSIKTVSYKDIALKAKSGSGRYSGVLKLT